jgi:hypothetical protein
MLPERFFLTLRIAPSVLPGSFPGNCPDTVLLPESFTITRPYMVYPFGALNVCVKEPFSDTKDLSRTHHPIYYSILFALLPIYNLEIDPSLRSG